MTPFLDAIVTEDLQSGAPPRGFYRRSNGDLKAITEMPTYHLKAAHAKTLREEPYRLSEVEDMAAAIAERDAAYAAEQAKEAEQ